MLSILTGVLSSMIAQALIVGRMSWDQSSWQTSQASEQEEAACRGYWSISMGTPKCVLETVCR